MLQCNTTDTGSSAWCTLGCPLLEANWCLQLPRYIKEMLSGLPLAAGEVFGAAAALQGKCPNLGKTVFDGIEKSEPEVGGNRKLPRQFFKEVFTLSLSALPRL